MAGKNKDVLSAFAEEAAEQLASCYAGTIDKKTIFDIIYLSSSP